MSYYLNKENSKYFNIRERVKLFVKYNMYSTNGENIICATKIRNNYCAIQLFSFPILLSRISLLPPVKLSLLIFFASFFIALSKVIALSTIAIAIVVPLYGKEYTKEA